MEKLALLFTFMFLILTQSSAAADFEVKCDAVKTLAVVTADIRLMVAEVSNREQGTCHFIISMPPTDGSSTSLQKAAELITQLAANAGAGDTAKLWSNSASTAMADALLKSGYFATGDFQTFLFTQQPSISDCAQSALEKNTTFSVWDEGISCGKSNDGNSFIMQSSFKSTAVSIQLPLQ